MVLIAAQSLVMAEVQMVGLLVLRIDVIALQSRALFAICLQGLDEE
jgi:hypothetical protein